MAGRTHKTEAIVLRSMRFSEADRILHLYTAHRGRIGAIAKGVRKTKSRFGARLEPLSHVELMLHEGAGELLAFSPRAGGAVCAAHAAGAIRLSAEGMAGVEQLLSTPLADAVGAQLSDRARRDALAVITSSYEEHGGFRLRTLSA